MYIYIYIICIHIYDICTHTHVLYTGMNVVCLCVGVRVYVRACARACYSTDNTKHMLEILSRCALNTRHIYIYIYVHKLRACARTCYSTDNTKHMKDFVQVCSESH